MHPKNHMIHVGVLCVLRVEEGFPRNYFPAEVFAVDLHGPSASSRVEGLVKPYLDAVARLFLQDPEHIAYSGAAAFLGKIDRRLGLSGQGHEMYRITCWLYISCAFGLASMCCESHTIPRV